MHRAVYLPVVRDQLPESLTLFDFADPSLVTGERSTTSGPSQALYLMNSPFVIRQAEAAAERLRAIDGDDDARIKAAYLRFLARTPTDAETRPGPRLPRRVRRPETPPRKPATTAPRRPGRPSARPSTPAPSSATSIDDRSPHHTDRTRISSSCPNTPISLSRRTLLKSLSSGFGYVAFAGLSTMAAAADRDRKGSPLAPGRRTSRPRRSG